MATHYLLLNKERFGKGLTILEQAILAQVEEYEKNKCPCFVTNEQFAFMFGGRDEDGGGNPIAAIVAALLAPFAAMIIQMAISRSREFLADEHSAHTLGSGRELESALLKLESWKQSAPPIKPSPNEEVTASLMFANMFSMQGLASLFSTHPSTADRVKRLRGLDGRPE